MQSAEDRRRLQGRYPDEEIRPVAALLKCAAGIVTLFAVAAGPWVVLSMDRAGTAAQHSAQKPVAAVPNSMEQSRRVYEERHQRALGKQENTKAALAK
jgi:hypothetical protein